MGMSASQARLLSITARLSHNELESQLITNAKTRLANKTQEANKEYLQALSQEKLVYRSYDAKGNQTAISLTPQALYTYGDIKNQYGISNASGQLLVGSLDARNYENSANLLEFLQCYGIEDVEDLETQQAIIEEFGSIGNIAENLSAGVANVIPSLNNITNANYFTGQAYALSLIEKHLAALVWGNSGNLTVTSSDGITVTRPDDINDLSLITLPTVINDAGLIQISYSPLYSGSSSYVQNISPYLLHWTDYMGYDDDYNTINTSITSDVEELTDFIIDNNAVQIDIERFRSNGWTYTDQSEVLANNGAIPMHKLTNDYNGQVINLVKDSDNNKYYIAEYQEEVAYLNGDTRPEGWYKDTNAVENLCSSLTKSRNGTEYTYDLGDLTSTGLLKVDNKYYDAEGKEIALAVAFMTRENDITSNNPNLGNFMSAYDFINANAFDGESGYHCVLDLQKRIIDLYCNVLSMLYNNNDNENFDIESWTYIDNNTDQHWDTYSTVDQTIVDGLTTMSYENMLDEFKSIHNEFNNLAARMTFEYKQSLGGQFSGEREWYTNLWYRMNGGSDTKLETGKKYYKELDDNLMKSESWIQFGLEHGSLTLEQVKYVDNAVTGAANTGSLMTNREWATLIYSNATEIVSEEDEVAIARAEAKYKSALNEIQAKDKNYDSKLKRLDNEHDAIKTEYESVKEVLNKNIDRSFKAFS